jgi:hypothetical protein
MEINGEIVQIIKNDEKESFWLPRNLTNSELDVIVVQIKKPHGVIEYLKRYYNKNEGYVQSLLIDTTTDIKIGDRVRIVAEPQIVETGFYIVQECVTGEA